MKNKNIILERVKLLMKYEPSKTLNENIVENNIILENVINEADAATWEKAGQELATGLKDIAPAERTALENVLKNVGFGGIKDVNLKTITSVDDLIHSLEAGTIAPAGIGTIKRGLLRSGNVKLAQKAASSIASLALKDAPEYLTMTREQIISKLKSLSSPYSESEAKLIADEMIAERGATKVNPAAAGEDATTAVDANVSNSVSNIEAINEFKPFQLEGRIINSEEELLAYFTSKGMSAGRDINININKAIGEGASVKQEIVKRKYVKSGKYAKKGLTPEPGAGTATGTAGATTTGAAGTATTATEASTTTITKIEDDLKQNKAAIEENTKGSRWDKWKKAYPKIGGFWKLVLGGAGIAAFYYLYKKSNDTVKVKTFGPCVSALLDDNGTTIAVTSGGDPVIYVKNTGDKEYDTNGGLLFYPNGRVFYKNNKRRGTYTCNGQQLQVGNAETGGEESDETLSEQATEISPQQMHQYVDDAATNVRGWVVLGDLKNLVGIMHILTGKTYKGKNAVSQFLEMYHGTFGHDFVEMIKEIGTSTLGAEGYELKKEILDIASAGVGGDNNPTTGLSNVSITWDGESAGGQTTTTTDGGNKKDDSAFQYHDCSSKNLDNGDTIELGCISPYVKKLQECIGSRGFELTGGADGKFGPSTSAFLGNAKVIDKALYDQQMAMCAGTATGTTTGSTATTTGTTATTTGTTTGDTSTQTSRVADMVKTQDSANKEQEKTPEIQNLIEKGLSIYTNLYDNYKKEGRPKPFIKKDGDRLKYKGSLLSQEDLDALNQYIKTLGYSYMKQKDKDYVPGEADEKYVWIKNKEAQPAAEPQQLREDFIKNIVGKHLRSRL
jgi:hypothetical protein